jgi:hypothetical protein
VGCARLCVGSYTNLKVACVIVLHGFCLPLILFILLLAPTLKNVLLKLLVRQQPTQG